MDNIAFYQPPATAEATKDVATVPVTLPSARSTLFLSESYPVDDAAPNYNGISASTGMQWNEDPTAEPYRNQG